MADWLDITDTSVDPDAPLTSQLAYAWRDNPIAIAEGAPGAPRIQFAAMDASFSTAGGLGSYVFAARISGTGDVAFGGTIAGSNLGPAGATYSLTSSSGSVALNIGSALSGTWQCMGTYDHATAYTGGGAVLGATLWLRIA